MKQNFEKKYHDKFKQYFNIKKSPGEIEKNYYNKAVKYIKYIKWIPWLKMIWIWNSISMNCAKPSSDIDLYIVTSNNSMWFVRILITLVSQILWVRKTAKKHKARFCLSFFSTTDWMDFSNFKLENDIYLYFWIVYFKPILSYDNTYELFLNKNSNWADFNEYSNILKDNRKYISYKIPSPLGGGLGRGINKILKKIFLLKTLKHYKKLWKPKWIIINDNLLKFHNNDIREKIQSELLWNNKRECPGVKKDLV